jgi:hypothetical protein
LLPGRRILGRLRCSRETENTQKGGAMKIAETYSHLTGLTQLDIGHVDN